MKKLLVPILVVVLLFGALIVDLATMLLLLAAMLAGLGITKTLNKSYKNTTLIYIILFISSSSYMIACYYFMTVKGFEYLFAPDIYGTFFPMNESYLEQGNYWQILAYTWGGVGLFDRYFVGYYTYTTFWGVVARAINANLFVTLQISTLFLYSFIGVVVYRLFLKCNFTSKKSYKYTLIISLCSIAFFYSTIFIRDIHIALLYLIGIYLTFNSKFSIKTLLSLILIIIITSTFRIESGLFLIVLLPIYLLLTIRNSKYKIVVISISFLLTLFVSVFYLNNRLILNQVFIENREHYYESDKGEGVTGTLQKIPVIGDFALIFFNALQPIPFFRTLQPTLNSKYGEPMDNIMSFPRLTAAVFNWIVVFYIIVWLLFSSVRKRVKGSIPETLKYHLLAGLIFFLLQSSVISQRRLISYYIIYYILFYIIYTNLKSKEKKQLNIIALTGFVLLQITGLLY